MATLLNDINKAKQRLIKQYHKRGLSENFGQNEVRKLRDNYGTDYTWQRKTQPIDDFDKWCMNFTSQQVYSNKRTHKTRA